MTSSPTGPLHPASDLLGAEAWIFDLDNTLYHHSANLFADIDRRMKRFIAELLDLPEDDAFRLQKAYFREFGTTLRGLMNRHGVEPQRFLDFVHDIDLSVIGPDRALDSALAALPGRKIVFTNADAAHAERILNRLDIRERFEAIYDIFATDFVPKPDPEIYRDLVEAYGLRPAACIMVEDIARNLIPAEALGMTTVWIDTGSEFGRDASAGGHIHYRIDHLSGWLAELTGAA